MKRLRRGFAWKGFQDTNQVKTLHKIIALLLPRRVSKGCSIFKHCKTTTANLQRICMAASCTTSFFESQNRGFCRKYQIETFATCEQLTMSFPVHKGTCYTCLFLQTVRFWGRMIDISEGRVGSNLGNFAKRLIGSNNTQGSCALPGEPASAAPQEPTFPLTNILTAFPFKH